MAYKLVITEHADELLDSALRYLVYQLKNEQAAIHLLDEVEKIYNRLEENPMQFPLSQDVYLASRGYHEAIVGSMNYTILFRVEKNVVMVAGLFHQLENYWGDSKKI